MTDLQESGWDAGDRASVPDVGRASRSRTSARCRKIWRSRPPASMAIVSSPRFAIREPASRTRSVSCQRQCRHWQARHRRRRQRRPFRSAPEQTADVTFAGAARRSGRSVDGRRPARRRRRQRSLRRARHGIAAHGAADHHLRRSRSREAFYVEQALVAAGADGRGYEVEGVAGSDAAAHGTGPVRFTHGRGAALDARARAARPRAARANTRATAAACSIAAGADVDGEVRADVLGG